MTLFQYFIEFSKLSDLEKKYLMENAPNRYGVIKEFKDRRSMKASDFLEVERALVEKGWICYWNSDAYYESSVPCLAISSYHQSFFREYYANI